MLAHQQRLTSEISLRGMQMMQKASLGTKAEERHRFVWLSTMSCSIRRRRTEFGTLWAWFEIRFPQMVQMFCSCIADVAEYAIYSRGLCGFEVQET